MPGRRRTDGSRRRRDRGPTGSAGAATSSTAGVSVAEGFPIATDAGTASADVLVRLCGVGRRAGPAAATTGASAAGAFTGAASGAAAFGAAAFGAVGFV